ncbi:DUF6531 domain-containing protein [Streptomyces sp. S186]|uniref:DUF6531 domain-containing protein n=1 Tax=Streptomyces sp. S186 TaxID=3434395 RepID=UPI003F681065
MSNRIVKALEHGAEKLGKALAKDASKAVQDLYHDAGGRLKKVATNHAENDAKHARELENLLKGRKEDMPHAPRGASGGGRPSSGGRAGAGSSTGGTSRPGQASEGNGSCRTGGDPVDVVSGQMITSKTDVDLPGLLPLVLRRSYASGYQAGRLFGPGWSSTLDVRVEVDARGIQYVGDDAEILHYPRPVAADEPVFPEHGARWPLFWDEASDTLRVEDPETGWTRHFDAVPDGSAVRPLTALTDRNGHRISCLHDDDGFPTGIEHSGGYRVAVDIVHTPAGIRVEALRLLDGTHALQGTTLMTYAYDVHGRLTDVINASGRPLVYAYDSADRITSWTDRNGYSYTYAYDPQTGRVSAGIGPDNRLSATFGYDTVQRITTVTDSLGQRTAYHYDQHDHVVRTVNPAGNSVHTTYDPYGRLTSHTDELGNTTHYTRDAHGEPLRIDWPDGTAVSIDYNELRLPVRVENRDGTVWRYAYDARGNLTDSTDPAGAVTRFAYDEQGRRVSRTDALGATTRYQPNAAGLPLRITAAGGGTVSLERDAWGRVVTATDAVGGTVRQGWTTEGDLAWRVAADGSREEWEYDPEGNLTAHRDPAGGTTAYAYGAFDMPSQRIDPDGSRYLFDHDSELRLVAVTNPAGLTWSYTYDETGCLTTETDFNNRTLRYGSDAAGRLTERVNGAGQSVRYLRDAVGRVVSSTTGDGATTTYAYDRAARLIRATTPDCALEYTYDVLGRPLTESIDGRVLTNSYDAAGRRTRRVTPTGVPSEWTYDAAGLPATLATLGGNLTFRYDAAGRETTRFFGTAAALTQSWDSAHQLAGQAIWAVDPTTAGNGAAPEHRKVQSRSYTYRADGLPTEIVDDLDGTRSFSLDAAGRVTALRAATWTESYAYDSLGNLAQAAYPAADDAVQGTREHTGTLVRAAGRTTYQHDAQGRLVRATRRTLSGQERDWQYTWDAEDRLIRAVTPDGATWSYGYDALGRRVSKTRTDRDGGVTERVFFSWDGVNLAEQLTVVPNQASSRTWDWDPGTHRAATQLDRVWETKDELPQSEVNRRFHAIVTDLIGTPRELVTLSGEIAWRASATLWGHSTTHGTSRHGLDCPLRFPGQFFDAETGLHYNLARYYDPDSARYLSPDPLGLEPAPNHHAYVDNPLRWMDPLGLAKKITRIYDDSTYKKHGSSASSSRGREIGRAPADGQAALDRSIDLDPNNPKVTRRLGVDHKNNEIVVLDRHEMMEHKDGSITETYHGHVQSKYPSDSVSEGDLTKLKRAGMINNLKKQRVLPPPCE